MLEVTGIPLRSVEECFGRNFFGLLKYNLAETVFPNQVLAYLSIFIVLTKPIRVSM